MSVGVEPPARQHDRDLARHERGGRGDIECAGAEIDLDRGLGADGQAVADVAHVDAAILRRGAGIEKVELEETVLGAGLAAAARARRGPWRWPSSAIATALRSLTSTSRLRRASWALTSSNVRTSSLGVTSRLAAPARKSRGVRRDWRSAAR